GDRWDGIDRRRDRRRRARHAGSRDLPEPDRLSVLHLRARSGRGDDLPPSGPGPVQEAQAGAGRGGGRATALRGGEDLMAAILEASRVTKVFGGLAALRNLDLSIDECSIHGLICPNGDGNTMFVNNAKGFLTLLD